MRNLGGTIHRPHSQHCRSRLPPLCPQMRRSFFTCFLFHPRMTTINIRTYSATWLRPSTSCLNFWTFFNQLGPCKWLFPSIARFFSQLRPSDTPQLLVLPHQSGQSDATLSPPRTRTSCSPIPLQTLSWYRRQLSTPTSSTSKPPLLSGWPKNLTCSGIRSIHLRTAILHRQLPGHTGKV